MTKQLAVFEKKVSVTADEALRLTINGQKDMTVAVELLSKLNQWNDKITEEKEKVTKPLNEALKAERARWKPIELVYTEAIDSLRSKMSVYQTEAMRKRKEEEQAIAARIKAGKGNLSLEKAVEKIDALEVVEKEAATEAGLVQFRETAMLKITDASLIPREYLVVNEKALLGALKEGKKVAGAEIEIKQIAINYR